MIKELANFTKSLDENLKTLGLQPKEGLHILLKIASRDGVIFIDENNYQFEIFSKKQKKNTSDFLSKLKILHQNAWCIDTNKCFDLPMKAIQTCSPFCVAFKREHLTGGGKFIVNAKNGKSQIYDRFGVYFEKALNLIEEEKRYRYDVFKFFFTNNDFSKIIKKITEENTVKREAISSEIAELKDKQKSSANKSEKEELKTRIQELEQDLLSFKVLDDSDYILFYLDLPLDDYKKAHKAYLDDRLFNTDKYNTDPSEEGIIYGTSNFMNGYNSNMPFLTHQTAPFDISGRISNIEAKLLYDFNNILPNKTLPNPLPIFIYKDELQQKVVTLFKESGYKMSYKEMVESLIEKYADDLSNYYLLYWVNTKDGIVFKDFDFVSKFEYELETQILNLFEIKEKDSKNLKHYSKIRNVFDFEQIVFKQLLQSKYLKLDYFNDLSKDDYEKKELTFISYSKFRKSVYDFVYKSQRQSIDGNMFNEIVFNGIKDDIKQGNGYGIKEKLNIWYSIYEFFNKNNNTETMASKLQSYQQFVDNLTNESAVAANASDEQFAFAAGQVIYYILEKSKSADTSYQLLEPYLQKSKCAEFKQVIANDFARYKHENFSRNFERVASFVLSYETNANIKHLLPEILSGVFAKNQLFSNKPQ